MEIFNSAWLTGIISGVVVALFNYFLGRRKTSAEVKKLEIEAEKIRLEAEKLRKELSANTENIASIGYKLSNALERILYDSNKVGDIGFDFKGQGGKLYKRNEKGKDIPITPEGVGSISFDKGIINIERTNTEGRYEIWLQSYYFENDIRQFLPKDVLGEGSKRIRLSCEVKVTHGQHTLKFTFKGQETQQWLGHGERTFEADQWTPITLYFNVSAKENSKLRIDDQAITKAPSNILIRNFVLAEKI
jgi:hypothetical protein